MRNKILLFGILFLTLFMSGCVQNPEDIAKANPIVKDFLEKYPNAELQVTHFTTEQSANLIEDIRKDCNNPYAEAKDFYRVTIEDAQSGLSVIAWIDYNNKIVECANKKGIVEQPSTGGGGGQPTSNETPSSGGGGGQPAPINETPNSSGGGGLPASINVTPNSEGGGTVKDEDNTPPIITITQPKDDSTITTNSIILKSTTDEDASCQSRLTVSSGNSGGQTNWKNMDVTGGKTHTQNLQNLITGNSYKIEIKCTDASGNEVTESVRFSVVLEQKELCIDSDNGKKYDKQGTVEYLTEGQNDQYTNFKDKCVVQPNQNSLIYEGYCENGQFKMDVHDCPEACVHNPDPYGTDYCGGLTVQPTVTIETPSDGGPYSGTIVFKANTNLRGICELKLTDTVNNNVIVNWEKPSETYDQNHEKNLADYLIAGNSYQIDVKCYNSAGYGNTNSVTFSMQGLAKPDLTISDITLNPPSPSINSTLEMTAVIYNAGAGSASGAISVSCEITYPSGEKRGGGTGGPSTINAGEIKNSGSCGYPLTELGTYTIMMKIDPSNTIQEIDDNNNEKTKTVTIS